MSSGALVLIFSLGSFLKDGGKKGEEEGDRGKYRRKEDMEQMKENLRDDKQKKENRGN